MLVCQVEVGDKPNELRAKRHRQNALLFESRQVVGVRYPIDEPDNDDVGING